MWRGVSASAGSDVQQITTTLKPSARSHVLNCSQVLNYGSSFSPREEQRAACHVRLDLRTASVQWKRLRSAAHGMLGNLTFSGQEA